MAVSTISSPQNGYEQETEMFSNLDFLALTGLDAGVGYTEDQILSTPLKGGDDDVDERGSRPVEEYSFIDREFDSDPGPGPTTLMMQSQSNSQNLEYNTHPSQTRSSLPGTRRNSLHEEVDIPISSPGIAAAIALARNESGKGKSRGRIKKRSPKEIDSLGGRRDSPLSQQGMEGMDLDRLSAASMDGMRVNANSSGGEVGRFEERERLLSQYQNLLNAGISMETLQALIAGNGGSLGHVGAGVGVGAGGGNGNAGENGSEMNLEGMEAFIASLNGGQDSTDFSSENANYEAFQAGLLQQQLESVHMQSPMVFGQANGQSAYTPLSQMYLTSPPAVSSQNHGEQTAGEGQSTENLKWRGINAMGGIMTPGPSGEMFPENRNEMMSPMQLEMLAREGMELNNDFNVIPLLSPALTHNAPGSSFTSPANHAAFNASGQFNNAFQNDSSPNTMQQTNQQGNHQLEQLQAQQRHFQEQLLLLQQQQRQMAATAAAVAAASVSPYMPTSSSTSSGHGHSHPVTTPGANSRGGTMPAASPNYFSPLTSPALGPANRNSYSGQSFSPSVSSHTRRTPHPLSALSSPALNPIGSSGGAQQTLSPALGPQNNVEMADPGYLQQLTGYLEGSHESYQNPYDAYQNQNNIQIQQDSQNQHYYGSPVIPTNGQLSNLASPAMGASSSSTGPHRSSLPSKTRPSPMMKPSSSRGHGRQSSHGHALPSPGLPQMSGMTPLVMSPHISSPHTHHKYHNPIPGVGFLPPSAIDQKGVAQHQKSLQSGASTTSTPSPVDLAQIMPPPPVPGSSSSNGNGNSRNKGMTPMTPASLMNLSGKQLAASTSASTAAGLTRRPSAKTGQSSTSVTSSGRLVKKASVTGSPALGPIGKKGIASKIMNGSAVNAAGGKRSIAIRPNGVLGVRASAKANAAIMNAATHGEPETRKTSHKAAEQKRRDSLKAGFDELRLLLPPINTEALDPESGEPIPGSSAPRLLPKSSLVPDDNPNRGVSKVALLKYSNEYIGRLHDKVGKRDWFIEKLREEVSRLRDGGEDEIRGDEGEDLLDIDMTIGEEEDELPEDGGTDEDRPEGSGGGKGTAIEGLEEDEDEDEFGDADADMQDDEDYQVGRSRRKSGNDGMARGSRKASSAGLQFGVARSGGSTGKRSD